MTAEKDALRAVVLMPVLVWLTLLALLACTVSYALWPHSPFKPVAALSISAAKGLLIGVFFMRLNKATPLVRMASGAGLVWLSIMFVLVFADYLTRAG